MAVHASAEAVLTLCYHFHLWSVSKRYSVIIHTTRTQFGISLFVDYSFTCFKRPGDRACFNTADMTVLTWIHIRVFLSNFYAPVETQKSSISAEGPKASFTGRMQFLLLTFLFQVYLVMSSDGLNRMSAFTPKMWELFQTQCLSGALWHKHLRRFHTTWSVSLNPL